MSSVNYPEYEKVIANAFEFKKQNSYFINDMENVIATWKREDYMKLHFSIPMGNSSYKKSSDVRTK